ncbi:Kef family K(+) transporter [Erythrobacter vulgaris]|uniref:Kef family K(+) transporter n=1 Tax=Qipengyuania vulgaris TaxID=291985 RepID=A0A844XMZ1_9SPHN|nr:YbaL family putative K(+) efflux transporter [Qipengyuania vulgaris]MXO47535.1 Kef family K(+) transporter [Qipengyuania vulgaris]
MPHHTPLIATIVAGLVVAFAMGALAYRLRVSPVAGYLFAGVLIGPFTPGFVADTDLAVELAEIGVILLMFGVGLHFSLKDLLSVRKIALPGALAQIAVATLLGFLLARYLDWTILAGLIFGLALSVASTVVLLRALQTRNAVQTERGRIAVGWLIVEDLAMVIALVLLPVIAQIMEGGSGGSTQIAALVGLTLLKIGGFIALMLIVGKRLIPAGLHWVAHTGSRELFRLAVLSIALGVAFGAAYLFDVSFALGAFFAGMILGESQLSRRAAEETLPLRDAFAVLFFVSVGMLFDPSVVVEQPWPLLATVAIIIFGKSIVAYGIVRAFRFSNETALTVSASLAQIGEFSFILAGLGVGLNILPQEGRDLILAGAILSIFANPFIFTMMIGRAPLRTPFPATSSDGERGSTVSESGKTHTVLVGYGRVGKLVARELRASGSSFSVVEYQEDIAQRAPGGLHVITGNAAIPAILEEAGLQKADRLVIAIPGGFEAGGIAQIARELKPAIEMIARCRAFSRFDPSSISMRGAR